MGYDVKFVGILVGLYLLYYYTNLILYGFLFISLGLTGYIIYFLKNCEIEKRTLILGEMMALVNGFIQGERINERVFNLIDMFRS